MNGHLSSLSSSLCHCSGVRFTLCAIKLRQGKIDARYRHLTWTSMKRKAAVARFPAFFMLRCSEGILAPWVEGSGLYVGWNHLPLALVRCPFHPLCDKVTRRGDRCALLSSHVDEYDEEGSCLLLPRLLYVEVLMNQPFDKTLNLNNTGFRAPPVSIWLMVKVLVVSFLVCTQWFNSLAVQTEYLSPVRPERCLFFDTSIRSSTATY